MNDKKNIDRLFQEKFKDFEATPNEAVWEKIKARQHQKKKQVVFLPFWYRAAGVAALLAVIFTIAYYSGGINTTPEDIVLEDIKIPDTQKPLTPNNQVNDPNKQDALSSSNEQEEEKPVSGDHTDQNPSNYIDITNVPKIFDDIQKATATGSEKNPIEPVIKEKSETATKETILADNTKDQYIKTNSSAYQKEKDLIQKNIEHDKIAHNRENTEVKPEKENSFLEQPIQKRDDKQIGVAKTNANTKPEKNLKNVEETTQKDPSLDEANKKSIFDAMHKEEAIVEEEQAIKKWNIAPNIAPVYYNSFGDGSSIDPQFADNTKNGQVNLSYGVQVSYNLNERLSVRSGVNKVDLSYGTQDVGFSASSIASQNLQSINYNSNAEAILVSDIGSNQNESAANDFNRLAISQTQNEGLLNQRIGYIEVPLEMKYALVNKKLGVNMIGGVSTLFLQDNEVSVLAGDFETTIGEANNLNEVSFTGNIGVGVDYKLSDQFIINLEPIFKYQFNGFSGNTENFRPYYFGVYTGVSIKF